MIELNKVAQYVSDKIELSKITREEYITTDNMIPNRGGVVTCENLPSVTRVTKYIPQDILISNIRPYFKKIWYSNQTGGCSNDVLVFRVINKNWDTKFLYYVLSQDFFFDFMMAGANGTKMPRGNKKDILNFSVPDFDLSAQKRIASILSAYDDLIENNKKQIKLLEEAAQRLYKEWFVDLRFPGHENVPVVDGVPAGWEKKSVGDICTLRKESVSPSSVPEDTPYIGLEHMPKKDFCLSTWAYAGDVASNKFIYKENDILFGKIRPYFHKVGFALTDGVASTDAIVMLAKKETLWSLLLMTVFSDDFVSYSYQNCKEGAKMPRADWKIMKEYPVLIPLERVLNDFERNIRMIAEKTKTLALQNIELSKVRDFLLPKLMSSEIEV